MDEYIIKQKVTDRMGCCLAYAKAEYKAAKDEFTKARFGDYISAIQAMIDVVECSEAADVQPVKHGRWIPQGDDMWLCSNCKENIIFSMHESDRTEKQRYCCKCGARMDGDTNG